MAFMLKINGTPHEVDVDGDTPMLWLLCDVLGMTGTKFGCGQALSGACTRACRRRGDALFTRRPHHYGKPRTELLMRSLLLLSITAIAAGLAIATGPLRGAADAAQGEHAFAKCAVCHAKDKSNGIGPGLLGVI